MYKVNISILEGLKKQLEANNKVLESFKGTPASYNTAKANKLINANNKQIKLLKDEFYID